MGGKTRTSFQPGNKLAVGNKGGGRRDRTVTQAIIAKLHEAGKAGQKANVYRLVDALFALAVGQEYTDGEGKTVVINPDLAAIREIIDRAEGKAPQSIGLALGMFDDSEDDRELPTHDALVAELERRGLPTQVFMSAAATLARAAAPLIEHSADEVVEHSGKGSAKSNGKSNGRGDATNE